MGFKVKNSSSYYICICNLNITLMILKLIRFMKCKIAGMIKVKNTQKRKNDTLFVSTFILI